MDLHGICIKILRFCNSGVLAAAGIVFTALGIFVPHMLHLHWRIIGKAVGWAKARKRRAHHPSGCDARYGGHASAFACWTTADVAALPTLRLR
jgi:hypothetical protein